MAGQRKTKGRTKEEKKNNNPRWENSRENWWISSNQAIKGGESSDKGKEIVPEDR
ncbi:Uncharacterized protein TCM_022711 [Theobroma cacao]|uniref:Uncharacterized protein n=1 Tax=Theobroma cacao TaxID=3641 RepID=A0A061EU66_THECC|nr:Uncharacterized protein TCM_022711 [Theobroma cacao]